MPKKEAPESVARVTVESTRRRVRQARLALQQEASIVKDLLFLKANTKLTPTQEHTINDALRKAVDIVAIYSAQYASAAIELIALNLK